MLKPAIYQRIAQMALVRDPQQAVYGVRIAATTTAGADTFTNWQLQLVTHRPATLDEIALVDAALSDQWRVWQINQLDLDYAVPIGSSGEPGAPSPLPTYTLTINGALWVIEKVLPTAFDQHFPCLSRLGR